jgi:hypothetical protein
LISKDGFNCFDQCVDIARLRPLSSVGEHFREGSSSGRNDGNACGHCLKWGNSKSFEKRGVNKGGRSSEKVVAFVIGKPTGASDA